MSAVERARAGFAKQFGHEPDGVIFAPGRVNLIGEHVDYNDGLVLPMPISVGTAVAWSAAHSDRIDAVALDFGNEREEFELGAAPRAKPDHWTAYLHGMAASTLPVGGARIAVAGSIPRGAGLSSSASLCVALGRALAAAAGEDKLDPQRLALAAQACEHRFAGVNCGIMDQLAIAAGKPGAAVLLDCRDLTTRRVVLPQDWAVMIVQSGVTRGLVDGHYNARRRACEAAAAGLGVASLRDVSLDQVESAALDPLVRRRARHVVTEIARAGAAVAAIERHDIGALGALLSASHASLRDDFEVTVPAVDCLVDTIQDAIGGAGSARMTGGGFGGAVVAVLPAEAVAGVCAAIHKKYRAPDGKPVEIMIEKAAQSAAGGME